MKYCWQCETEQPHDKAKDCKKCGTAYRADKAPKQPVEGDLRIDPDPYRTTKAKTWLEIKTATGWEPIAHLYLNEQGKRERSPYLVALIETTFGVKIPAARKL